MPIKALFFLALLVGFPLFFASCSSSPARLRLATTTSTENSGLLKAIIPDFENKYEVEVEVVAVGTGQAIALGERGDADVLLVHARDKEDAFVASGNGVNRQDVMYNDFVVVGPRGDPAGISGQTDVTEAFRKIAAAKAAFISRGDDSGTHAKEKSIWQEAGLSLSAADSWYLASGQGMGATLSMAQEKNAYTLTDRATYLAWGGKMDLNIVVKGDQILYNPYGVIAVNPEKHPGVNYDLAMKFIDWLTSVSTQQSIADFGKDTYGQPLFFPNSAPWHGD